MANESHENLVAELAKDIDGSDIASLVFDLSKYQRFDADAATVVLTYITGASSGSWCGISSRARRTTTTCTRPPSTCTSSSRASASTRSATGRRRSSSRVTSMIPAQVAHGIRNKTNSRRVLHRDHELGAVREGAGRPARGVCLTYDDSRRRGQRRSRPVRSGSRPVGVRCVVPVGSDASSRVCSGPRHHPAHPPLPAATSSEATAMSERRSFFRDEIDCARVRRRLRLRDGARPRSAASLAHRPIRVAHTGCLSRQVGCELLSHPGRVDPSRALPLFRVRRVRGVPRIHAHARPDRRSVGRHDRKGTQRASGVSVSRPERQVLGGRECCS